MPHRVRVYFDTCTLNRPFDDQGQARIRLEAEAVGHLLQAVEAGRLEWVTSEVVAFEIARTRDLARRALLQVLLRQATRSVPLSAAVGQRAREFRARGVRDLDALHLAAAEAAPVETLVTTDEQFGRAAGGLTPPSTVRVMNPVTFALEVLR